MTFWFELLTLFRLREWLTQMRTSILPLRTFHTPIYALLSHMSDYLGLAQNWDESYWRRLSPDTCSCSTLFITAIALQCLFPLLKPILFKDMDFCLLHLLSSVLSTDLGLESMLEKYLMEDCVKKWGWVESRRRVLKIQCNYSRNWVTIIRPLALRLKINKQTTRNANFPNSWYENL